MERKIGLLFVSLMLAACGPTWPPDMEPDAVVAMDDASGPDVFAGPTDEEIMANYEADVAAYQNEAGLSTEWAEWMILKKDWWRKAYINGRRDHEVRVYVRYESAIAYNPPWLSEYGHFAALRYLAELQYPGWYFTFLPYEEGAEAEMVGNDAVAVLGHSGYSNASGHTIYLVYETIFAHEFGHTLGLHHHYCGDTGLDHCPENFPPGEGKCVMARDSSSFGPTEIFLLQLTGERPNDEISAAIFNISDRYPEGYGSKRSWDECGMEK